MSFEEMIKEPPADYYGKSIIYWTDDRPEREDTYLITWYGVLNDGTKKGPYIELAQYYPERDEDSGMQIGGEWDLDFIKKRGYKDVVVDGWAYVEPWR